MSSMAPSKASRSSACPTCRTSCRKGSGRMANFPKVDVVIVGGGAAGCLIAAKLGQKGKKVVILEQGPAWEPTDLISSQIWNRRLKWAGAPVQLAGKNP